MSECKQGRRCRCLRGGYKIAEELPANRVGVSGAAGAIEKELGEALCAILVRQLMENDARVLVSGGGQLTASLAPPHRRCRERELREGGRGDPLLLRAALPSLRGPCQTSTLVAGPLRPACLSALRRLDVARSARAASC